MKAESAKLAVVGAGWAGLAAAIELVGRGHSVTLFEAGRVAGGRARSVRLAGRELDNGQHLLLGAYRDTLNLMHRVGIDAAAVLERRPLQVVDADGFRLALPRWPAPLNLAWGLMTARGVSLAEKLRTAIWMQALKRRTFRLAPPALDAPGHALTVAAWLDSEGQTGALRRHLWEPLCLAALNTPAERASAQHFANVLRDSLGGPRREDTDLLLPRVPLGQVFPEPAVRWLERQGVRLRFGHRVRTLAAGPTGVLIDDEAFDGAILATAPSHLEALAPDLLADQPRYEYEPIATVYLQFPDEAGLAFPIENRLARGAASTPGITPLSATPATPATPDNIGHAAGTLTYWVVDRGNGLLACVFSGHGDWETLDDAALAAAVAAGLKFGAPVWHGIIREKRATFSCRPGLARPDENTQSPRLFLAGDHTWADYPATLEGAVRSGLRAARGLSSRPLRGPNPA